MCLGRHNSNPNPDPNPNPKPNLNANHDLKYNSNPILKPKPQPSNLTLTLTLTLTQKISTREVIVPWKGQPLLRSYFTLSKGVEACCGGCVHTLTATPNISTVRCADAKVPSGSTLVITCDQHGDISEGASEAGEDTAEYTLEAILGASILVVVVIMVVWVVLWRLRFQFPRRKLLRHFYHHRRAETPKRLVCDRAQNSKGIQLSYTAPYDDKGECR